MSDIAYTKRGKIWKCQRCDQLGHKPKDCPVEDISYTKRSQHMRRLHQDKEWERETFATASNSMKKAWADRREELIEHQRAGFRAMLDDPARGPAYRRRQREKMLSIALMRMQSSRLRRLATAYLELETLIPLSEGATQRQRRRVMTLVKHMSIWLSEIEDCITRTSK